jgi:PKD repeat protein
LSGTPASGTGGTYPLTFTATNNTGTNTQSFTLTVNQPPSLTNANSATFSVGSGGSFTIGATGFPAPALSASGALPSGVTFVPATGVLSGTPAAGSGGTFPLVFTAANSTGTNTQNFTLTVNQAAAITSANNTAFAVGSESNFTVTATGFPAPTLSESGALPAGVAFTNATGILGGTPASGTGGTYPITFTATNTTSTNTQSFTLTVNEAPAITNSPGSQTVGSNAPVTLNVLASGTPAPVFQWYFNGKANGATNASFTLPSFQASNQGTYQVVAGNYLGTATSAPVVLLLNSPVRLGTFLLTNGAMQLQLVGSAGSNYVIQVSSNLILWTPLLTNTPGNGLLNFTDTNLAAWPNRFYRAVGL